MEYTPSRLVERAWINHPRCLSSFAVEPLRNPPVQLNVFDDLGFFQIACLCGAKSFRALGYPQDEGFFASPLTLCCVLCNRGGEVFDIAAHGYDAELGHGCYSIRGSGAPSPFKCASCQSEIIEALVGVSYQIEPIEDMDAADQERSQDLFDWFYLEAICKTCGTISGVSDYECA